MGKLTDWQLQQWIAAGVPIHGRSDGYGLTFTLSQAGTAAWILRYRFAGQKKELTLGRYPELSLADARRMADVERQRIANARDVAAEKAAARKAGRRCSRFADMERELSSCEAAMKTLCDRLAAVRLKLQREEQGGRQWAN